MYEELIERLHYQTNFCENTANGNQTKYWLNEAADTIGKLETERDYITKYIPHECETCKYWRPLADYPCANPSCKPCHYTRRESWEWKGIN